MRCPDAKRLIVLDAGDLSPADAGKLSAHLASCETCRQFAALPVDDPSGFRAEVPLMPADFTRIRANVRASLRERRTRDSFMPFALWAPAAAAAVIVALSWFAMRSPGVPVVPPQTASRPELRAPAVPSESHVGPQLSPEPIRSPKETSGPRVARSHRQTPEMIVAARPAAAPEPIVAGTAQASPRPLLIEIHTADPDVRILWIAQQAPAEPSPTTSMEE